VKDGSQSAVCTPFEYYRVVLSFVYRYTCKCKCEKGIILWIGMDGVIGEKVLGGGDEGGGGSVLGKGGRGGM
jgi:hypothetical protein